MTTATPPVSTGPAVLEQDYLRDQSWLERTVGPEWHRLLKGVVTNPLSVVGLLIVLLFVLMAAFAPVLAPQPDPLWDTKLIPRDGFRAEPQPPGSVWTRAAPETSRCELDSLVSETGDHTTWMLLWVSRE